MQGLDLETVAARPLRKEHERVATLQDLFGKTHGLAVRRPAIDREGAEVTHQWTQHRHAKERILGHEEDLALGDEQGEGEVHVGAMDRCDEHRAVLRDVGATGHARAKQHPGERGEDRGHHAVDHGLVGV